jgi:PhzF family phenazine biosynthesis protein
MDTIFMERPMRLPIYQVDAFADRLFRGNPAAVVPLAEWLPEATMQAIAAENNLAETAFFVRDGKEFAIRWFTPAVEATLCGHATLASAFVVSRFLDAERRHMEFSTRKAGTLVVERQGDEFAMDFPTWQSTPAETPAGLAAALGGNPTRCLKGPRDLMAVFESEQDVAALKPDFVALARACPAPVIATAPGSGGVDFVSRFFAPSHGIDEDPVTGSAHCALIPYWAGRLGRTELQARQISARTGALSCSLRGDRVTMAGRAALYLEGTITI